MEQQNLRWWIVVFVIVTAFLGYVGAPIANKPGTGEGGIEFFKDRKIALGLDLQGGSELRVEFDPNDPQAQALRDDKAKMSAAINKAQDTLQRRINLHGVKEPRIQVYGDSQILIQLPGHDKEEMERVKKIVSVAGKLEFHIGDRDAPVGTPKLGYHAVFPEEGTGPDSKEEKPLMVRDEAPLTGADVDEAVAAFGQDGWEISLRFAARAARVFGDITTQNVHQPLAIILDNKLVSAPNIKEPITGGQCRISGRFTKKQAEDLATVLKSGSLAAKLSVAGENYVGPILGQDSIRRGLTAGGAAVAGVILFMLIYYRMLGVIANVAMLANVAIVMGILAMFGATLTLPGIAGIVLTLGMAVDANILIFERIREEVARGRTAIQSFDAAYERAFITIIDCHVTTFSAAVILYYAGTGPIQGFAVTLGVGIVSTLATSLLFAKVLTRYMILGGSLTEFRMMKLFDKPNFGFARLGAPCFVASLLAIAAGFGIFLWRGKDNMGIDFRGGTILNLQFNNSTRIEDVRNGIKEIKGKDNVPVYDDAEVQSVVLSTDQSAGSESKIFSIRVADPNSEKLKEALENRFKGQIPARPIVEQGTEEKNERYKDGYRLQVGLSAPMDKAVFQEKLKAALVGVTPKDTPPLVLEPKSNPSNSFDLVIKSSTPLTEIEAILKKTKDLSLSVDPFPFVSSIGASVATEMKSKAAWALLGSWAVMIIYLAFRFEFIYGLAAVFALIHDVMFSLGFVAICHWLMPKTWGIDLSLGLSAVAAYLTIVGYSVNDTIVVFDRIRENLKDMRRDPFSVVMDASVNQTLSRTILTSFTVFITVVVLFAMTARSGGGIASFAFPMTIGVVVGTYSSVFIASPIVMWYRGNRPAAA